LLVSGQHGDAARPLHFDLPLDAPLGHERAHELLLLGAIDRLGRAVDLRGTSAGAFFGLRRTPRTAPSASITY
jgi:hypothetical protein